MKILYVAASPIPSQAANSVHVIKMANALANAGHETILVSAEYCRSEAPPCTDAEMASYYDVDSGFKLYRSQGLLHGKAGAVLHTLQMLILYLRFHPDLVYSRCYFTAFFFSLLRIPVVFESHNDYDKGSPTEKLFTLMAPRPSLTRIVVISQALKEHFVANYGIPSTKILVAADGADESPDTSSPLERTTGNTQVGYVGHLYPGRGIDVIIALAQQLPDIGFHIIGGTAPDVAHWSQQAAQYPNLVFYGHTPHKKATEYLQSLDILLAPYQKKVAVSGGAGDTSRWMSPLKIFEYMAAGKPIICSDMPVLHEVLTPEVNCLLCPPDNVDAWAAAIKRLIEDKDLSAKLGAQAKQDLVTKYTWKARARDLLAQLTGTS
jgi:glycosyltransferase involved in cell wall biosynthesis